MQVKIELNLNLVENEADKLQASIDAERKRLTEANDEISALYKKIRAIEDAKQALKAKLDEDQVKLSAAKQKAKEQAVAQVKQTEFEEVAEYVVDICKDLPKFSKLHPYQVEDIVSAILAYRQNKRGMLNANDMGMGKTAESAFIIHLLNACMGRPIKVLWLTKKSLYIKGSTTKELKKWTPDVKVVSPPPGADKGTREFYTKMVSQLSDSVVFLTNYEYVRTTEACRNFEWDVVVIDEVHKLKGGANANGPTAIFTACKEMCHKAKYILMLSGTPMVNAAEEMWSYLHIFSPEKFPDMKQFRKDFMGYKEIAGQMPQLSVDPNKIMQMALKGQMIRRAAQEVGLELPELTYEYVELDHNPEQAVAYKQMADNFFVWLDEQSDAQLTATAIIAQLTRLRQINVWPSGITMDIKDSDGNITGQATLDIKDSSKIDETMDIIESVQDQVIVGCTFNGPLKEIQRRCKQLKLRCEIISGEEKHTFDVESEFQQGKIDVLCINTSMGEGLNLQKNPEYWSGGASYAIILDRWWAPGRQEQFVKRIHRQGSNIPVFVYELQVKPSIDLFLEAKTDAKSEEFANIMENEEIRPASGWKEYLRGLL